MDHPAGAARSQGYGSGGMTKVLALAGKGGTGKTTLAALLVRTLLRRGQGPVLAIDADPAMNLHLALGLPAPTTVGELREDARGAQLAISRHERLTHQGRLGLAEAVEGGRGG